VVVVAVMMMMVMVLVLVLVLVRIITANEIQLLHSGVKNLAFNSIELKRGQQDESQNEQSTCS